MVRNALKTKLLLTKNNKEIKNNTEELSDFQIALFYLSEIVRVSVS